MGMISVAPCNYSYSCGGCAEKHQKSFPKPGVTGNHTILHSGYNPPNKLLNRHNVLEYDSERIKQQPISRHHLPRSPLHLPRPLHPRRLQRYLQRHPHRSQGM